MEPRLNPHLQLLSLSSSSSETMVLQHSPSLFLSMFERFGHSGLVLGVGGQSLAALVHPQLARGILKRIVKLQSSLLVLECAADLRFLGPTECPCRLKTSPPTLPIIFKTSRNGYMKMKQDKREESLLGLCAAAIIHTKIRQNVAWSKKQD